MAKKMPNRCRGFPVHSKPAVQNECKKVASTPNPNPFATEISQNTNVDYCCFAQRDQKLGCGVFILKGTGKKPTDQILYRIPPSTFGK